MGCSFLWLSCGCVHAACSSYFPRNFQQLGGSLSDTRPHYSSRQMPETMNEKMAGWMNGWMPETMIRKIAGRINGGEMPEAETMN